MISKEHSPGWKANISASSHDISGIWWNQEVFYSTCRSLYVLIYLLPMFINFFTSWLLTAVAILLSTANKMQSYTIFFIIVNALHVSDGFFAHHHEFKNCTHSIWYMSSLLAATASGNSKQTSHIPDAVYSFWAPDDGRRNRPKHVEHWQ